MGRHSNLNSIICISINIQISYSAETILRMKWKLPGSLSLLLLYCELVMYSPPLHRPGLLMYTWLSIIDWDVNILLPPIEDASVDIHMLMNLDKDFNYDSYNLFCQNSLGENVLQNATWMEIWTWIFAVILWFLANNRYQVTITRSHYTWPRPVRCVYPCVPLVHTILHSPYRIAWSFPSMYHDHGNDSYL